MATEVDSVGIFGLGHVGRTWLAWLQMMPRDRRPQIYAYDPACAADEDHRRLAQRADLVLVCVPADTLPDGTVSLDCVNAVLSGLTARDHRTIAVCSTLPPDWPERVHRPALRTAVHLPVFFGRGEPFESIRNRAPWVVGVPPDQPVGSWDHLAAVSQLLPHGAMPTPVDPRTAALLKYATNAFGAVKTTFCNEIAELAGAMGADPAELLALLALDDRVGCEWTRVPGPDGRPGFGGPCLPKDTRALQHVGHMHRLPMRLLGATLRSNALRRP